MIFVASIRMIDILLSMILASHGSYWYLWPFDWCRTSTDRRTRFEELVLMTSFIFGVISGSLKRS